MTIGNLPQLDTADISRLQLLIHRIKTRELAPLTIFSNLLDAMGKFQWDRNGIQFASGLQFQPDEVGYLHESAIFTWQLGKKVIGKKIYLHMQDIGIYEFACTLPLELKEIPAADYLVQKDIPVFIIDLEILEYFFQGFEGMFYLNSSGGLRIRNYPVLIQWLGEDWRDAMQLYDCMVPLMALTTKEKLIRMREPFLAVIRNTLARCGV